MCFIELQLLVNKKLTVRLLVTRARCRSTEFLGLCTARISDKKWAVVLHKNVTNLFLGDLIHIWKWQILNINYMYLWVVLRIKWHTGVDTDRQRWSPIGRGGGGPGESSPGKLFSIEVLRNWISNILRPSQRAIMSGFLYQLVEYFSIFSSIPYLTLCWFHKEKFKVDHLDSWMGLPA